MKRSLYFGTDGTHSVPKYKECVNIILIYKWSLYFGTDGVITYFPKYKDHFDIILT